MQPFAPGLDLNDVNMTLGLIPVCGVNIVKFFPKYLTESTMPMYAAADAAKLGPVPQLNEQQKMVVQQSKLAGGTLPAPTTEDQAKAQAAAIAQGQAAPQGQLPVVTDPSVIAAAQSAEAQAAVAASAAGSAVSAVAAGAVPSDGQAPAAAPVQA